MLDSESLNLLELEVISKCSELFNHVIAFFEANYIQNS